MSGKPLAEPKLFSGTLSLEGDSVEVSATIGIDASGELTFEFTPIPLSERSRFILLKWHQEKSDVVYFSFRATAEDGTRFETEHLFLSSLGTASDQASGTRLTLSPRGDMAILRYALKEPLPHPALRMRLKGFRNFGGLRAECALGQLEMGGPHDRKADNEANGWLTIQASEPPPDLAAWRAESQRLLEHIRRIMSLAASAFLRAPVIEFIAGVESEGNGLVADRSEDVGDGYYPFHDPGGDIRSGRAVVLLTAG